MPTPSTAKWPKPKSEDEFEDISLDFLKLRWGDPNATRNGRRGQGQNGIDVYGVRDGKTVGAQCKNTERPTLAMIIDEVEKARSFRPQIREFLFVVAADRDSRLQEEVRSHFDESPESFAIRLAFWEDVVHQMAAHPDLVRKHWKGWSESQDGPASQPGRGTSEPETWSPGSLSHEFALATLLGQWLDDRPADQVAVAKLSDRDFDTWTRTARTLISKTGCGLRVSGTEWSVPAAMEAWEHARTELIDADLDRFEDVAGEVLGERDPKLDLRPDERWAATVYGRDFAHSVRLRDGIARGLALLGTHGHGIRRTSQAKGERVAMSVIRGLLNDADADRWQSLDSLLPVLAEAAPGPFLSAVEAALGDATWVMDLSNEEYDALRARPPLTGLTWALETLAWEPDYIARSAVLLAELASAWGSQRQNPALDALTHIFMPWYPRTRADSSRRLSALRAVVKEQPGVASELLLRLLPERRQLAFPGRKPEWRNPVPQDWEPSVSVQEYENGIEAVASLTLELAEEHAALLPRLIEVVHRLPQGAVDKLLAHLGSAEFRARSEEERTPVWESLLAECRRHRRFADADWALPSDAVDLLESTANLIAPVAPSLKSRHLFEERAMDLVDERGLCWSEVARRQLDAQVEAIRDVLDGHGLPGVQDLARSITEPGAVGRALAECGTSQMDEVLFGSLEPPASAPDFFSAGYVSGRLRNEGWSWVDGAKALLATEMARARFLLCLPFVPETWDRAEKWLADAEAYWRQVRVDPYVPDGSVERAVDALISVSRFADAALCLYRMTHVEKHLDAERAGIVLLGLVREGEDARNADFWKIGQLIRALQKEPKRDEDLLVQIEWAYASLLDGHHGVDTDALEDRLARQPEFFCELVRVAYRSERDLPAAEANEHQQALARNAWDVLHRWARVPGTDRSGEFSSSDFESWLVAMQAACAESGHLAIANQTLGNVLIHAPADPDGLWIHGKVATALNARDAEDLRMGYRMGWYNSRGAAWIDPDGQPEKDLAATFRKRADEVEMAGYHRLADVLKDLEKTYLREAERNIAWHRGDDE